ncbi:hypothetical protein NP233_g8074 [Leucocoprinus birnbaumii]|uniref:Uncharacterized protein n=1 Tax=Leucocoprinus birnbaumii TaxID=56174 RepID=A0AAD5VTH9_9AGAR|nr:hypothetical protein NP233_g8074 [Leucocoprinus birnbaumii]
MPGASSWAMAQALRSHVVSTCTGLAIRLLSPHSPFLAAIRHSLTQYDSCRASHVASMPPLLASRIRHPSMNAPNQRHGGGETEILSYPPPLSYGSHHSVVPPMSHTVQSAHIIGRDSPRRPPVLSAQPLPALQPLQPDLTSAAGFTPQYPPPVPAHQAFIPPSLPQHADYHSAIEHPNRFTPYPRFEATSRPFARTQTEQQQYFFCGSTHTAPNPNPEPRHISLLHPFQTQLSEPPVSPYLQPSLPQAATSQTPSSPALSRPREYIVPHQAHSLVDHNTQSIIDPSPGSSGECLFVLRAVVATGTVY